jgi:5'-3' exonuclease
LKQYLYSNQYQSKSNQMGIKNLNRFFRTECKESVKFTQLAQMSGKKIAVDISIYMYKYAADDSLIENIYLMLSVFRHYSIIPIFIFDGKPPAEKKALLQKRKDNKIQAQIEYNNLKAQLNSGIDEGEKQEILNTMDMLKRNFIHISKEQIQDVKSLMRSYGATYYDAPGEADELCALLAIKNKVWACLSEDMDMFVYGCPRVIRYLSLLNHTVVLYDLKEILDRLGITQKELREICILSGTDYNMETCDEKSQPKLFTTLKLFKKFHKQKNEEDGVKEFYDWLMKHTKYIKDYELLQNIYSMFELTNNNGCLTDAHSSLAVFETIKISNGSICKNEIKQILQNDGFIFPVS